MLWALNKDPADRPADADQFIAALEHVKQSILSGTGGQHTASMPALVDVIPAVALAAAAAPSATGTFPPQPWDGNGAGEYGPVPPDEGRRWWLWLIALLVLLLLAGGGVAAYLLTRPVTKVVPNVVKEQVEHRHRQCRERGTHAGDHQRRQREPARHRDPPEPAGRARRPRRPRR